MQASSCSGARLRLATQRQLRRAAPETLSPVMVRGGEGMAIFHDGPPADVATRPVIPQTVRRHRMLRPPL